MMRTMDGTVDWRARLGQSLSADEEHPVFFVQPLSSAWTISCTGVLSLHPIEETRGPLTITMLVTAGDDVDVVKITIDKSLPAYRVGLDRSE